MKRKISKKDLQRAQDFIRYKNDIVTFAEECIYLPLNYVEFFMESKKSTTDVLFVIVKDSP